MNDPSHRGQSVDKYICNRLTESEVLAFELALLDSNDLQIELQTALAIREVLSCEGHNRNSYNGVVQYSG